MKINRQFHDLHSTELSADWVLKQHVERDICLLYHQLANYSYIMGDLYWGPVFGLPYWEYLDFPGVDTSERDFIRDGCLVMMLAMTLDDGGWNYITEHIPECEEAISRAASNDKDTSKLARAVLLALEVSGQGGHETKELQELSKWVHRRYVRGYFRRIVEDFDNHPYFSE